jgi:Na+-driven multidrug efflux pump
MSTSRVDLKTGKITDHLVRLTIPMIWGIAAIVSFQLIDTYYVSLLGTKQLAAMTFTFPVTFLVFTIIMGFGIAMSSVVSRLIGEGREDDVKRVTTHGLILAFGVGLGLAVVGYIFRDAIFAVMGADAEMVVRRPFHGDALRGQLRDPRRRIDLCSGGHHGRRRAAQCRARAFPRFRPCRLSAP